MVDAEYVAPYKGLGGPREVKNNTILKGRVCLHPNWIRPGVAMHEIGHVIGFFGHTFDGGIMGGDRSGKMIPDIGYITEPVMRLLYSYPPGTDVETIRRNYKQ